MVARDVLGAVVAHNGGMEGGIVGSVGFTFSLTRKRGAVI